MGRINETNYQEYSKKSPDTVNESVNENKEEK